jgi:MYXO-CTERM domain-containing protein
MTFSRIATVVFALLGLSVAPASAGSITIFGMDAELEILSLADSNITDGAYTFRLTLDTSDYVAPDASLASGTDWLTAVAIDFGTTVSYASLVSPDDWSMTTGHATQGGCANGPNDWTCLQTGSTPSLLDGSTYTWVFMVDFLGDEAYDPVTSASLDLVVSGLRLKPRGGTQAKSYVSPLGSLDWAYVPPDQGTEPDPGPDPIGGGVTDPVGGQEPAVPNAPEPGAFALLGLGGAAVWARTRQLAR